MSHNDVNAALDIVIESIQDMISTLSDDLIHASKQQAFDKVYELGSRGQRIDAYKQKILALKQEWTTVTASTQRPVSIPRKHTPQVINRHSTQRLENGAKTQQLEFRIPILRILVNHGGSAGVPEILDALGKVMVLNAHDNESLPSNSDAIRWQNTAQWERHNMKRDGLLSASSPHGIWEITDKGRDYLRKTIA